MWIFLLFVVYVDGTPYTEAGVVASREACVEMQSEFNQYVREDETVKDARFNCIRVPVKQ